MKKVQYKKYGYFDPKQGDSMVQMNYMQRVSGYPVGIVYIDEANYPMVPGNVNNAYTFDFPVLLRAIPGLTQDRIFSGDPTIADEVIEIAQEMIQLDGIRCLSSGCGFFGNFQQKIADNLDIPCGMSALIQVPWVETMLKSHEKIGVLTANAGAITDNLFKQCKISDPGRLIVKGLREEPEFSCIPQGRGYFDNNKVRDEVVGKALEIQEENEDVGAIVLECTDMPPYSQDIQMATQLPVFDFITLINYMQNAVCQPIYRGWI